MWWLIPIAAGGWLLKKLLEDGPPKDSQRQSYSVGRPVAPSPKGREPAVRFEVRGSLGQKSVLVVGRTGAGKSSLINMLRGEVVLAVGDVGSTTRWLECVECSLGNRFVTMVDSPGIGEALTNTNYSAGIVEWFKDNSASLTCVALVLQADAKAHEEDWRLIHSLAEIQRKPLLVVLSQVDKINPVRESLMTENWATECLSGGQKSSPHHGKD